MPHAALADGAGVAPQRLANNAGIDLEHWEILGPLPDRRIASGRRGPLDLVGLSEALVTQRGVSGACEHSGLAAEIRESFYRSENTRFLDFNFIYGLRIGGKDVASTVAYASHRIVMKEPAKAYLLWGSSNEAAVWLNGKRIHEGGTPRGLYTYDNVHELELVGGENILVFRIPRTRSTWGLVARLEWTREAATVEALERQGVWQAFLVEQAVAEPGALLPMNPRAVPAGQPLQMRWEDLDGAVIDRQVVPAKQSVRVPPNLSRGIYRLVAWVDGRDYWQWVLVGDPEAVLQDHLASYEQQPESVALRLSGVVERLRTLVTVRADSMKSAAERWSWERRFIFALARLQEACAATGLPGERGLRWKPGLRIHSYRSAIDGAVQHYRVYIPTAVERKTSVPLVVMLPTLISANRPFLTSAFMAAHVEAERIAYLAEKSGAAVVWTGYRNRPTGLPIENTHVREVLADVRSGIEVDEERISLMGSCSGGALALRLSAAHPESYSAIALLNPTFELAPAVPTRALFEQSAEFTGWLDDELNFTERWLAMGGLPCRIEHDGGEPGHGEWEVSLTFTEQAAAAGVGVQLEQSPQTVSQHFGAWDDLISWASAQKRVVKPATVVKETNTTAHAESIIATVAEPFAIVQGTLGTDADREEAARIAAAVAKQWASVCFHPCKIYRDTEYGAISSGRRLVLIGDERYNQLARSLNVSETVRVTPEGMWVKERGEWSGTKMMIHAALPKVRDGQPAVLISGTTLNDVRVDGPSVLTEAWYSLAVFNTAPGEIQLVAAVR